MNSFNLTDNEEVEAFCHEIVEIMVHDFGIPPSEAIMRINRNWQDQRIEKIDNISHEWPQYWASFIYYEPHEKWWIQGDERSKLDLPPLKPRALF